MKSSLNEPQITRVYHWSPSENRTGILQEGLKILLGAKHYENPVTKKMEVFRAPYICTSLDPWTALCYCLPANEEAELLDLFEVELLAKDRIEIRNDGRNTIIEIRIKNSIPADRVIYLGTRRI